MYSDKDTTSINNQNILYINEFKPKDVGVYLCKTKDFEGRLVEIGIEFKLDTKNGSMILVNSIEKSLLSEDELLEKINDTENYEDRLPNIRITFSDKLALARGERVELFCDSGETIIMIIKT
jgi:hypothetical protein